MTNIVRIKRRAAGGGAGAPASLENAELAFNEQTNILYYGKGTGGAGGTASQVIAIGGDGAFAPIDSPDFTGTPTAPTPASSDDSDKIATTAFVKANISAGTVTDVTATAPLASSGGANPNLTITQVDTDTDGYLSATDWNTFNNKAPTNSPSFTGTPTAPTQANTDTSTKIATTAHVKSVRLDQFAAPTADVSLNNNKVTNLAAPSADTDAANKAYVDSIAQGLDPKASCLVATTGNITLAGTQTIDGQTVSVGDRVLVKAQTAPAENGIYVVASGAWSRAPDADSWAELVGAFTFIEKGSSLADSGWVCTVDAGGTLGTTAITWVQFSAAGSYTAGTGLTLTGNQFSITNTTVTAGTYGAAGKAVTASVNAQGQLTALSETDIVLDCGTF